MGKFTLEFSGLKFGAIVTITTLNVFKESLGRPLQDRNDYVFILQANPVDFGSRIKKWMMEGFEELGDFGGMGIGATTLGVLSHEKFDAAPCEVCKNDYCV